MRSIALVALVMAACGGGGDLTPGFPADYATTYQEVRDCRSSADHDLGQIRVLADPAAVGPYRNRDARFPRGAVVLKVEYDFSDPTCTGPITQWTAMMQIGEPSAPGWGWQQVDRDRNVVSENDSRCIGCHAECGGPPDGYLGTCAVP